MSARNNRILHIDGDSFFASCEIALDPNLEGRPVWVGGGRRGDGIVIAANRLAKKYGIKTGTACFEAKRLCPRGVLCRPHYDAYRELSRQMFLILEEYAPTLVPYSIDEGFLDFSTMDTSIPFILDLLRAKAGLGSVPWRATLFFTIPQLSTILMHNKPFGAVPILSHLYEVH